MLGICHKRVADQEEDRAIFSLLCIIFANDLREAIVHTFYYFDLMGKFYRQTGRTDRPQMRTCSLKLGVAPLNNNVDATAANPSSNASELDQ